MISGVEDHWVSIGAVNTSRENTSPSLVDIVDLMPCWLIRNKNTKDGNIFRFLVDLLSSIFYALFSLR